MFQDDLGFGQTFDVDVIVHPEDPFSLGTISVIIVMFGLLVDSLGLAAVYVQYKASWVTFEFGGLFEKWR